MKKRKLKGYVLPTIYLLVIGIMAFGITFLSQSLLESEQIKDEHLNYTMSVFDETNDTTQKQDTTSSKQILKPFVSDQVTVAKEYYSKDDSSEKQEEALIYYENTYMPNTGILYESAEPFEVVAVLDGTVKEIKQDEILGNVITITHNNNLTTIYYTAGETKVKIGDDVTMGETIATSGTSKLQTNKPQTLLFETYLNGVLTNPNQIFEMSTKDFN